MTRCLEDLEDFEDNHTYHAEDNQTYHVNELVSADFGLRPNFSYRGLVFVAVNRYF